MNPDAPLAILTALADFLLKVTFAFAVVWSINRLVDRPNQRFLIWLSFLAGAGTYWIWLATRFIVSERPHATIQHGPSYVTPLTPGVWQIPTSWALPLNLTLRGTGILYLLVLSCFLISHVKKQMHVRWVLGFACKPPIEVAETFRIITESLQVGKCRLLLLTGITTPATLGWIRPTVLLPALCLEQECSEVEDVLRHELHHVRRRDYLLSRVAALFRALLFFHPAAWYAVQKLQFERELACDLAVVSDSPATRVRYAECLVRFARLNLEGKQKPWGIDFAASSVYLTTRVRSILTGPRKSSKWSLCFRAAGAIVFLVASLSILPSLAIVVSYVQQQVAQPTEMAVRIAHSRARDRARVAKRNRPLATPEKTDPATKVLSANQPAADQISQLALGSPSYPEVVYASAKPIDVNTSSASESEPSDNTPNPGVPQGRKNKPGIQQPSLTSIIMGAARQIGGLGGHDHDHDHDFQ